MVRKNVFKERNGYPVTLYSAAETYENQIPEEIIYRSGNFCYRYIGNWAKWPQELWGYMASSIAVDRQDNVYVSLRCKQAPICKFDPQGNFIKSFGSQIPFSRPHGLYIDKDDTVWFTDDGLSVVWHIDQDGNQLDMLGTYGKGSDTGYDFLYVDPSDQTEPTNFMYVDEQGNNRHAQVKNSAYLSIKRMGPPFNKPTKIVRLEDGTSVISDGYGNAAVHVFDQNNQLVRSWGGPGTQPGRFSIPHALWVDRYDRVWVCDRENERMEIFDLQGKLLKILRCNLMPFDVWTDENYSYVIEGDGRISIFSLTDWSLLAQIGYWQCQDLIAHAFMGNSKGDLFCADLGVKSVFKLERLEAEKTEEKA